MFASCIGLRAGLWHVAFGWANIRKYDLRSPSLAIVRSKVVFWLLFLASWFLSFLVGVSESPSMFSRADGFHFSFRWSIMACAALQHLLGSVQPRVRLFVQLLHWHVIIFWWIFRGFISPSR